MAWFYRAYAKDLPRGDAATYEQAENDAKAGKRGLWSQPNPIAPWFFRRPDRGAKGAVAVNVPVAGGHIIGNRNSKIYHLPNCPDYNKVSEKNRVPFKTEAEAQAAGYRKARNCPQ
jgi:hypothetical protein